jgi:hypothetical protein
MALTKTKLNIRKKHLKPKCDSSSKNETLKFLGCKYEDPWKPRIKGILAWNSWVELINGFLELAPCYSHGIPNTVIGAILNVGNWVHHLEVQCMSLFDQTKPHSTIKWMDFGLVLRWTLKKIRELFFIFKCNTEIKFEMFWFISNNFFDIWTFI